MIKSTFAAVFLFSQLAFAKIVILDVRTPQEFQTEHISKALNFDVNNDSFVTEISKLNKNDDYEVYCRSGRRSAKATEIMINQGFKKVTNLGGLDDAKRKYNKI